VLGGTNVLGAGIAPLGRENISRRVAGTALSGGPPDAVKKCRAEYPADEAVR